MRAILPPSAPRGASPLLAALLFALSTVLPWVHLLLSDHEVLPGGEVVCVAPGSSIRPGARPGALPGQGPAAAGPAAPRDAAADCGSCPFFGTTRDTCGAATLAPAAAAGPAPAGTSAPTPPDAAGDAFPRFLLAPKHSPPRA